MHKTVWHFGALPKLTACCISILSFSLLTIGVSAEVVVSIRPIGMIAVAIASGVTEVSVLVPPGGSPHDTRLTPAALKKIKGAAAVFWIGPGLESFLVAPLAAHAGQRSHAFSLSPELIPLLRAVPRMGCQGCHAAPEGKRALIDWHLWLSPPIAAQMAQMIYQELVRQFPAQQARLQANLARFLGDLQRVVGKIRRDLAEVQAIPYCVFHESAGYFSDFFGLRPAVGVSVNPEYPMSAKQWMTIRTRLAGSAIQVLFTEPSDPQVFVEKLRVGLGLKRCALDTLGDHIELSETGYCRLLQALARQFRAGLGANDAQA